MKRRNFVLNNATGSLKNEPTWLIRFSLPVVTFLFILGAVY